MTIMAFMFDRTVQGYTMTGVPLNFINAGALMAAVGYRTIAKTPMLGGGAVVKVSTMFIPMLGDEDRRVAQFETAVIIETDLGDTYNIIGRRRTIEEALGMHYAVITRLHKSLRLALPALP